MRAHIAALATAGLLAIGGIASATTTLSYTVQQADAGRNDYLQNCAECHGGELEGNFAPGLAGPNARDQWESPQYVYGYFSVAMPHGHPGQLTQQQYVDIMAYLLHEHARPAGTRPLTVRAITADTTPIGPTDGHRIP
jgi:mono/diheme cytochrome c family protein